MMFILLESLLDEELGYSKGMTTGDIEDHMWELYDIDISDSTISRLTDKIMLIVRG